MKLSLQISKQDLSAYRNWFLMWGIALSILGVVAIAASAFTTLITVILIGFLILISGAVILIDTVTFWWSRWPGFFIHLVIGLLYFFVGVSLINNPVIASASLTLLLGIFYILIGASRITYSLSWRVARWQWAFVNGFVSLLLGILIVTNLPSASLFIIGLFVGIDLLFSGFGYIMSSLYARQQ